MFPTRQELRDFYAPAKNCRKNVASHLFFRLALLALAMYIANETGKIVTLISKGASFSEALAVGNHVYVAIGGSLFLLAFTVWQKAGWPHVESRLMREARRKIFSEYLGKEVSVTEATGKTIGLFES